MQHKGLHGKQKKLRRRGLQFSLGKCSAKMLARYSILGSYLMDITELQQVQPYTLMRFAKASKRYNHLYNLSVISGLRIGPKLTTASALDSMLSSPKVKVRC